MASTGKIQINLEHLRDGDGALGRDMELWSCRNGPAPYNKWQSVYFALLREHGYEDEYWTQRRELSKDVPRERQERVRNLWT